MGKAKLTPTSIDIIKSIKDMEKKQAGRTRADFAGVTAVSTSVGIGAGGAGSSATNAGFLPTSGGTMTGAIAFFKKIVTVASGVIDIGTDTDIYTTNIIVVGDGGADDLDTIDNPTHSGQMLFLQSDVTTAITLKHATDNIWIRGGADYVMAVGEVVILLWDEDNARWVLTSGFNVGGGGGDVPDGANENDHLQWDGGAWVARQTFEFGTTDTAIADSGFLRFINDDIMLSGRNLADDGNLELKIDSTDFLDLTNSAEETTSFKIRSQHATEADQWLQIDQQSGDAGIAILTSTNNMSFFSNVSTPNILLTPTAASFGTDIEMSGNEVNIDVDNNSGIGSNADDTISIFINSIIRALFTNSLTTIGTNLTVQNHSTDLTALTLFRDDADPDNDAELVNIDFVGSHAASSGAAKAGTATYGRIFSEYESVVTGREAGSMGFVVAYDNGASSSFLPFLALNTSNDRRIRCLEDIDVIKDLILQNGVASTIWFDGDTKKTGLVPSVTQGRIDVYSDVAGASTNICYFDNGGFVTTQRLLMAETGDPSSPTNAGYFYVKDVGGDSRPFYIGDGVPATDLLTGAGGGDGHVIEDEETPLTQRAALNFEGAGVIATDDAGNDATVVTITTSGGAGDNFHPSCRLIGRLDIPNLNAMPITQDLVASANGDRILLVYQDDKSENGIWEILSGVGLKVLGRPADFDNGSVQKGMNMVSVTDGRGYGGTTWVMRTRNVTVDTTDQVWEDILVSKSTIQGRQGQDFNGGSSHFDLRRENVDRDDWGNYAHITNTAGTFAGIANAQWQPGSVVYLTAVVANTMTLTHDETDVGEGSTATQITGFWLAGAVDADFDKDTTFCFILDTFTSPETKSYWREVSRTVGS